MGLERICQNCINFVQEQEDYPTGLGVCASDPVFEPYLDEIFEFGDFSKCREAYLKTRYDGGNEVCPEFEAIEVVDIPEIDLNALIEKMKTQDIGEITNKLYDRDQSTVNNAISSVSQFIWIGNEKAYIELLNYYNSLGPAETLDDVHGRIRMIDVLSSKGKTKELVDAFVNELFRTQSNNTTRKLYSEILNRLSKYPIELIQDPLFELLGKKNYNFKIKGRIQDVALKADFPDIW